MGDVEELDNLASLLGCKVGQFSYPSLLLGVPHKSFVVWDATEERFSSRRLTS